MHIPSGDLALQGSNQASNQLGKLTAGVSHFLFMAAGLGCVNSIFPTSPHPPRFGDHTGAWTAKLRRKTEVFSKNGHTLLLQKANNLAERERFLGSLV